MLLTYALFGFLAGVMLNFMPCILPILSIKLNSVLKKQNVKELQKMCFQTILGILTFAFLFSVFLSFGTNFWGFQMQNSGFVASLIFIFLVFLAISLNLFYINSVDIPVLKGSFFEGFLIVIFSASCSGPIIGVAISLGMQSEEWYSMILVFMFLAFGLCLPYFLVLLFKEKIAKFLLKSKFSVFLKRLSNLMLFITLLFLVNTLFNQQNLVNFSIFIGVMVLFLILLFFYKNLFILLFGVLVLFFMNFAFNPHKKAGNFEEFSEEKLNYYLEKNYNVVVRFEASWCLTCFASDAFNDKKRLEALLLKYNTIMLKGDLTNYNYNLQAFMLKFGVNALPFQMVFTPEKKNGVLLSTIVSFKELEKELNNE